jgi:hypothetical protein
MFRVFHMKSGEQLNNLDVGMVGSGEHQVQLTHLEHLSMWLHEHKSAQEPEHTD